MNRKMTPIPRRMESPVPIVDPSLLPRGSLLLAVRRRFRRLLSLLAEIRQESSPGESRWRHREATAPFLQPCGSNRSDLPAEHFQDSLRRSPRDLLRPASDFQRLLYLEMPIRMEQLTPQESQHAEVTQSGWPKQLGVALQLLREQIQAGSLPRDNALREVRGIRTCLIRRSNLSTHYSYQYL
jgi:hypothetical protein